MCSNENGRKAHRLYALSDHLALDLGRFKAEAPQMSWKQSLRRSEVSQTKAFQFSLPQEPFSRFVFLLSCPDESQLEALANPPCEREKLISNKASPLRSLTNTAENHDRKLSSPERPSLLRLEVRLAGRPSSRRLSRYLRYSLCQEPWRQRKF